MRITKIKSIISISIIVLLFLLSSFLVQRYLDDITPYFDFGIYGMIVYVLITILSIVLAPISSFPLIPLASSLYGWKISALLNIIGWTIGAVIAFILARKYGVPLISKLIPLKEIHKIEKLVPKKNVFFSVVFLRMSIPVDGLSYALGLFSKMSLRTYTIATIIGITPFAIIFSYLGIVPLYYQIAFAVIGIDLFLIGLLIVYLKKMGKKNKYPYRNV